jgi:restriction system protein
MAEITIRRQGEIVQTLFRVLEPESEGLQAKDAIARAASGLQLTDYERDTFPNKPDVVRFPKVLRFATINSVKLAGCGSAAAPGP